MSLSGGILEASGVQPSVAGRGSPSLLLDYGVDLMPQGSLENMPTCSHMYSRTAAPGKVGLLLGGGRIQRKSSESVFSPCQGKGMSCAMNL